MGAPARPRRRRRPAAGRRPPRGRATSTASAPGSRALAGPVDVVVKVDADVDFDPDFCERLDRRASPPTRRSASRAAPATSSRAASWVRRTKADTTVWGATRAYRAECLAGRDGAGAVHGLGRPRRDPRAAARHAHADLRGPALPPPPRPRAAASSPRCTTARPWAAPPGTWATGPATSPCGRSTGRDRAGRAGDALGLRVGRGQARAALPGRPWSGRCATASGCARPSAAAPRPPSRLDSPAYGQPERAPGRGGASTCPRSHHQAVAARPQAARPDRDRVDPRLGPAVKPPGGLPAVGRAPAQADRDGGPPADGEAQAHRPWASAACAVAHARPEEVRLQETSTRATRGVPGSAAGWTSRRARVPGARRRAAAAKLVGAGVGRAVRRSPSRSVAGARPGRPR